MADFLQGLNPAQREAVESIDGPVLVVAGPGSGKTRVIVHRIAYLIKTCGVRPYRIMAVTFTNKAAREMIERVDRLVGESAKGLTIGTFHAIGARILRIEAEAAGLDQNFVIYDEDDQSALIKRAMQELTLDPKKFGPGAIKHAISAAKAKLVTPAAFSRGVAGYFDEVVARVYEKYEGLLRQCNAMDFDDLITRLAHLFEKNPALLEKYQDRYVHVLVDEFQDTNAAQYRLARLIAGYHRNLCVVGDPDQSIYSWRQADLTNILNFERDFPDAKVVKLEQNYRSTQTIVEAAAKVIALNKARKAKDLWTENSSGLPITLIDALDEQDEAQAVVGEIDTLVKRDRLRYGDCAVLYRTNAQSRPLEEAFVRYGLPYRLVGATRFYERREVKDVLAYMRLIHNPFDDVSLLRIVNVPSRGIGQRSLDELARWAGQQQVPLYTAIQLLAQPEEGSQPPDLGARAVKSLAGFLALIDALGSESREMSVARLIDRALERTGYRDSLLASDERGDERLENVGELKTAADQLVYTGESGQLGQFLENVALVSDLDNLDQRANAVNLITLHQAKGLEFPVVFMIGLEEGVLPHIRSFEDPAQMEEERRLCYVGMTRAQQRLYLLRAYRRAAMGVRTNNPPSRFLADIPAKLTANPRHRRTIATAAVTAGRAPEGAAWLPSHMKSPEPKAPVAIAFRAGERVQHSGFGEGVVVSCVADGNDQVVTVAFRGSTGVKRLLHSLANLWKLEG
jgi:DNA helicase-2/ATP-dependent DNA helicase PcrA